MSVAIGGISTEAGVRRVADLRQRLAVASGLAGARRDGTKLAHVRVALRRVALDRLTPQELDWVGKIEERRRELWSSSARFDSPIPEGGGGSDHGALRRENGGSSGLVAQVSRSASVAPVFGRLLMCLVRELGPRSCLELGTGFGVSGAYQTAGLALNGAGTLLTVEGAPEISAFARAGFEQLGLDRVDLRVGMLQDELDAVARAAAPIDFAFIDAHHDEPMTLKCFDCTAAAAAAGAVLVFDDIRRSAGMRRAWRTIAGDRRTAAAVDARRMGICVLAEPA